MAISQKNNEALKNPWVLGFLVFFCTFLLANIIFIYLAFNTPPNLVKKDFYEHGQRYEETRDLIEKEKALDWTGVLMVPAMTRVNHVQTYELLIQGKYSAPLDLDTVTFNAYRPSDASADFSVEMIKKKPGLYAAEIVFNLPGVWDVIVIVRQDKQEFLVTKRINILP